MGFTMSLLTALTKAVSGFDWLGGVVDDEDVAADRLLNPLNWLAGNMPVVYGSVFGVHGYVHISGAVIVGVQPKLYVVGG